MRQVAGALFIAIEGPNGVGKSTAARHLAARLEALTGRAVHLTTEPSRTALGALLRESEDILHGRALALALAADRVRHVEDEVIPALNDGRHVITDRYVQSSLVLQRIDGIPLREIWSYNRFVLPAPTFYLQDTSATIAGRLAERRSLSRLEATGSPEKELLLYQSARAFLERQGWRDQHAIDCTGRTPEQVVDTILDHLPLA